jgi:hypothetical protein
MGGLSIEACYNLQAGWVRYDHNLTQVSGVYHWQGTPGLLLECLEEYRRGALSDHAAPVFAIVDRIKLEALPLHGQYPCQVRLAVLHTGQLVMMIAERIGGWGFSPLWQGLCDPDGQLVERVRCWEEAELRWLFPHLPGRAEAVLYLSGLFAAIRWLAGEEGSLAEWIGPRPGKQQRRLFRAAVQAAAHCWLGPLVLYVRDGVVEQQWLIGERYADKDYRHLA